MYFHTLDVCLLVFIKPVNFLVKKPRKNKVKKDSKRCTKCTTNVYALASVTKKCDVGIKKIRRNEVLEYKSAIKVYYYNINMPYIKKFYGLLKQWT